MSNYKGPLEVLLEPVINPDGIVDERGRPIVERHRLRYFATTNPGEERVEVELRVGRGGNVFAQPIEVVEPIEAPELPPNESMRPVPPEARTTPFDVNDFATPEERARREFLNAETPEGRVAIVLGLLPPPTPELAAEANKIIDDYLAEHGDPAEDPRFADPDPDAEVAEHLSPEALAQAEAARAAAEVIAAGHAAE